MEISIPKKYQPIFMIFFISLTLISSVKLEAQTYRITLDGGRFMWRIEPRNYTATGATRERQNGIYPGDFRKDPASLNDTEGIADMYLLTSYDEEHPWIGAAEGLTTIRNHGSFNGDQVKYMRYQYPQITANGVDVGLFRDERNIIDPNLKCEMMGTNKAVNQLGVTWYTTTYTWSHTDYQDIVINHQQLVNDGHWYQWEGSVHEDTVSPNTWNKLWVKLNREYIPTFYTDVEEFKNFGGFNQSKVNWGFWGNGVTEGIDDLFTALMYTWVTDNDNSVEDNEGMYSHEFNRFHHPYYFGLGLLDASGRLSDGSLAESALHWWGVENFEDELSVNDKRPFATFLKAGNTIPIPPASRMQQHNNPHERDPDYDEIGDQRFATGWNHIRKNIYFGPFKSEIGDTINIWTTHIAGGIDPKDAETLGEEWAKRYNKSVYVKGWSDEDIEWKNDSLRKAGVNDMVSNYTKAQEIFNNGMEIPKMNLVPPASIDVVSGGGFIRTEWATVSGAVSYNIYRANGYFNSLVYDKIANVTDGSGIYDDSTALRNFTYYYYVTAVDQDGFESSHYVVRPQSELGGVTPASFQGTTLEDVRVVPNPFVFNPDGNYGAGAESRIVFAGLPGPCKITIYTLTGDIIDEIDHDKLSGSYQWDSRTKYNQFITPGLYIYHVESKNPDNPGQKLGKFIVIR